MGELINALFRLVNIIPQFISIIAFGLVRLVASIARTVMSIAAVVGRGALTVIIGVSTSLLNAINFIRHQAHRSLSFLARDIRAYYNIFGQYTAPLEQELGHQNPPDMQSINLLARIALLLINVPVMLASLSIIPLIYNSLRGFGKGFKNLIKLPQYDLLPPTDKSDAKSSWRWYRYVYAIPGLTLGAVVGFPLAVGLGLGRMLTNSFKNAHISFVYLLNKGSLGQIDFKIPEYQNHHRFLQLIGAPGYLAGALAATSTLGAFYSYRILSQSLITATRLSVSTANLVSRQPWSYGLNKDSRDPLSRLLGSPGLLLGLIPAAGALTLSSLYRIHQESIDTERLVRRRIANLGREPMDQKDLLIKNQGLKSYLLGLPGILTGLLTGSLLVIAILAERCGDNSAVNILKLTLRMTNAALENPINLQYLDQPPVEKYLYGAPGLLIGLVTGSLGFVIAGSGRILIQSHLTAKALSTSAYNLLSRKGLENSLQQDTRRNFNKFGLGFPGLILGILPATVVFGLSGLYRIHQESVDAEQLVRKRIANLARKEIDRQNQSVKHEGLKIYLLGLPGTLTGLLTGSLQALAILASRGLTDSWINIKQLTLRMTNAALESPFENTYLDTRSPFDRLVLGAPGLVIGLVTGSLGFALAGSGRILLESLITTLFLAGSAHNLISRQAWALNLANDKRPSFNKYGLGFPGLLLGIFPASTVLTLSGLYRIYQESLDSQNISRQFVLNLTRAKKDRQPLPEKLNYRMILTFGLPGLLFGLGFGGFDIGYFVLSRLLQKFVGLIQKPHQLIRKIIIASWHQGQYQYHQQLGSDQDYPEGFTPSSLGYPGAAIGYLLGKTVIGTIMLKMVLQQSKHGWQAMSGSLINGAINAPFFPGLNGNPSPTDMRRYAYPGYALALLTTGPIAAVLFAGYGVILATGLTLALLTAPLVAFLKAVTYPGKTHRFHGQLSMAIPQDEQRWKNLYSSVQYNGRLPAMTALHPIDSKQDGGKGLRHFLWKSLSFNEPGLTEKVMDGLLGAYKKAPANIQSGFFDSANFTKAVQAVKGEYNRKYSFLETRAARLNREQIIDQIAEYIKLYMTQQGLLAASNTPDPYRGEMGWTGSFFGYDKRATYGDKGAAKPHKESGWTMTSGLTSGK